MATSDLVTPAEPPGSARERAQREACRWAATMASLDEVAYLDTETTGLDERAEIIDIAVVDNRGHVLLNTLVRPTTYIPLDATRIHGIDDAMVADAPSWHDVYPELRRLLQDRIVVVYNAEFDLRLVNQMNRRAGFPAYRAEWHCAMQRFASFAAVWHARYGNYRWHKLPDALARFGHPPSGHRALADADGCRLVVHGMAQQARPLLLPR